MPESTTAIVGVGNIGGAVARHLVRGGESVLLVSKDPAQAQTLAGELGPLARAASAEDAIPAADAIIFALWLPQLREALPQHSSRLEGKIVIDTSNPVGFANDGEIVRTLPDNQSQASIVAGLLPATARYVKAFGSMSADTLAASANREPRRAVLFYAADDDAAATTIERLIRAAGFDPLKVGGLADAGRIEGPGGDLNQFGLNGAVLDLDEARAAIAAATSASAQPTLRP